MLVHLDSFTGYTNVDLRAGRRYEQFYAFSDNTLYMDMGSSYARVGRGIRIPTNHNNEGSNTYFTRILDGDYQELIVGVAVRFESEVVNSSTTSDVRMNTEKRVISIRDGNTSQATLCVSPSGRIVIRNAVSGTLLGRSNRMIRGDTYHFIEWRCSIHNTTGSFRVRVDGEEWGELNISNVDTQITDNAYANSVRLGSPIAGTDEWYYNFDDFYIIAVVTGTDRNDFLGDVYVEGILPTGNGASQQWQPGGGTSHYTLVDETPLSTTDNIRSNVINDVELFTFAAPTPTAGTILNITPNIYARKDEAGVVRIAPIFTDGLTTKAGTEAYLTSSYQYHYREHYTKNPITDAQWPINIASGLSFGVKRTG